jgi:hypothetical protein
MIMPWKIHRLLARVRMPLVLAGIALMLLSGWLLPGSGLLRGTSLVMFVAGLVLIFLPYSRRMAEAVAVPTQIEPPVRGRWIPVNSPANRVPSHGTHEYGQSYAIDLVPHPDEKSTWTAVRSWPLARRPEEFPGFGQPVYAPADGRVVRATGWQRDHWSRDSVPALVYVFVEGVVRQVCALLSGRFVLGNHIILDPGGGVYAVLAHLKQGALRVSKGQRVSASQQLAACGNSGNSTEPHLHFQLMDLPSPFIAAGLPFSVNYLSIGEERRGMPAARQPVRFAASTRQPA